MFHIFTPQPLAEELPELFTYPFCYTPHPLCRRATDLVMRQLQLLAAEDDAWQEGKMFGVLVARDMEGRIGYVAAYSGNVGGRNNHPFFVPPVYDLLNPKGYFRAEEDVISSINHRLHTLDEDTSYYQLQKEIEAVHDEMETSLIQARDSYQRHKEEREQRRTAAVDEAELLRIDGESQHEKAEMRRLKRTFEQRLKSLKASLQKMTDERHKLQEERRLRSSALQRRLFQSFVVHDFTGRATDLTSLFEQRTGGLPPAGSGECCAPKMLQYASLKGLQPLAMAEFWWGRPSLRDVRQQGAYYPACQNKCEPILSFMLQGLRVEPNPQASEHRNVSLRVVYEDEWLIAIDKPSGLLSVPGKVSEVSAQSLLGEQYQQLESLAAVHRLDQDTSGILLFAKTNEMEVAMRRLFERRKVRKRYSAVLNGCPKVPQKGVVTLPLRPDYENRPRQIVDIENGQQAVTYYELLPSGENGRTRVLFYPQTGRTHQLRVHAAHPQGLSCPILGDRLYGGLTEEVTTLQLRADRMEFCHPMTGAEIQIVL